MKIKSFFRHLPYAIWFAVVIYKINNSSHKNIAINFQPKTYVQLTDNGSIKNAFYEEQKPTEGNKVFVLCSEGSTSIIAENSSYPKTDTAWYQGSIFFHITEAKVL